MAADLSDKEYLNYLFSFNKFGTNLGLERIEFLLEKLGNPQNSFKSIHVAGTNGKGSTCSFIQSVLMEHGFKTGLYTSPHIKKFRERIRIDLKEITDKELAKETKEIKKIVDEKQKTDPSFHPTFFELSVAITYSFFKRKKIDFAVIETGLGGRLDATNVLSPLVSVITNISLEHTEFLGNTIQKIAAEKAGIIKPNSVCVTAESKPKALKAIKEKARKEKVTVFEVKKHTKITNYFFGLGKQKFDLTLEKEKIKGIEISLTGKFQLINAATALLALKKTGIKLSKAKIKKGMKKAFIAGRFQIINKNPLIVLDAGHNPGCFEEIKETLKLMKKNNEFEDLVLVIALSSDKNAKEISRIIFPLADKIVITKAKYRGMELEKIAELADKHKKPLIGFPDSNEAFEFALSETKPKDLLLAIGSIFFLGELNLDFT